MANTFKCEFFTVRYVPDLVKGEFVNIGVVLRDTAGSFSDVKLTRDWRRARCLDADVDVELLEALEGELRNVLRSHVELDEIFLFHKLPDWASNALQLTPMQAVYTDSPRTELARLVEIYCEAKRNGKRTFSTRQGIFNAMRDSFEQAGVWELMRKSIPVEQYAYKGDPLKIDCGYRPNGTVHLFQAVSLTTGMDSAKALAFSFPIIVNGIARLEKAGTTLTAIVEDDLNSEADAISYGLRILTESRISVQPMSMLTSIAQDARRDLRV